MNTCPQSSAMRWTGAAVAVFLLLVATTSASGRALAPGAPHDSQLARHLAEALRVPHVARAHSSAVAVDLTTGEQLYALNASLPLAPASNEKLALTFALLKTFTPNLRIETRVLATGAISGGTLRGSIVLVGGGDPSLSSRDLGVLAR